jgi:hypothetical protein
MAGTNGAIEKALFDPPVGDGFPEFSLDRLVMEIGSYQDAVPRWWSARRDKKLRELAFGNDYTALAINTAVLKLSGIPLRVRAKNMNVAAHQKLAEMFDEMLQGILPDLLPRYIQDLLTQDNGAFAVVMDEQRDASQPVIGMPTGIMHLDAAWCHRTGDAEYPIRYNHKENDGTERWYVIHQSRLLEMVEMRSPHRDMYGVGRCFMSRVIQTARTLLDMVTLEQETIGSRPANEIIHGEGFDSPDVIKAAFRQAQVAGDNAGLNIHSARVYLTTEVGGKVNRIPLRTYPDGFNKERDLTLGMYVIASAMGMDARELWPATASGATKADASIQHMKTQAKLPAWWIRGITMELENKFLPSSLHLVSDYTDDDQDERRAAISQARAARRGQDMTAQVTDKRVEREMMLDDGELSQAQFDSLELKDGRTPDGLPVRVLFADESNNDLRLLLAVAPDPLDLEANDPATIARAIDERLRVAEMLAYSSGTANQKQTARLAMAALNWLRTQYEGAGEAGERGSEGAEERESGGTEEDGPEGEENVPSLKEWAAYLRANGAGLALTKGEDPLGEDEIEGHLADYEEQIMEFARSLGRGDYDEEEFQRRLANVAKSLILLLFLLGSGRSVDEIPAEAQALLAEWQKIHADSAQTLGQTIAAGGLNRRSRNTLSVRRMRRRIRLWMNQARGVFALAQTYDPRNPMLKWVWTPGKDHCTDCLRLNGQVHPAAGWRASGWIPKHRRLECGGWECGCSFSRTDEAETGGY